MQFLLLGALFTYGVERAIETFWKWNTIKGRVIAPYTLYLLVAAHFSVFVVSLYDGAMLGAAAAFSLLSVVGLLLVVIAAIGRFASIQTLGAYHSVQIEIRKNHRLITNGPYRFVRHPYYVSNAIEIVGFPLIVNSLVGATLGVLIYWPCLYLRTLLEERALLEAIRAPFAEYMRQVPRFIPTLFPAGASV